ncbi:hypothetical protein B0T25DRAFT_7386 [Lasiosphaeria hispida]|uniref:Uncharacterized protein n=1 Tax=Lasiosphaeria hispida TaxID=260671 RepID=A0AAJ0HTR2_9PEZI|nr:hypothetical protein B0T25DRAFT_7386 [Lasiosphaeria hispida]
MKKTVDFRPAARTENSIVSHVMKAGQHVMENKALNRAVTTVSNRVAEHARHIVQSIARPEGEAPTSPKRASCPPGPDGMQQPRDDERPREGNSVQATAANPEPGGYENVRVLFLSWDSTMSSGPMAAIMTLLRELLGMSYNFRVHEFVLPSNSSQAEEALLYYLGSQGFYTGVEEAPEKELVIVIYNGYSARGLTSSTFYIHGNKGKTPWEWIERRFVFAPYDTLLIMNCYYAPSATRSFQRGTNMVVSALGPECNLRRQILGPPKELAPTTQDEQLRGHPRHQRSGISPSDWLNIFLETVLSAFEKNLASKRKVSVKDLYLELLQAHQVHGFEECQHAAKIGPYCDFITSTMQAEPVSIEVNRVQDDENDPDLHDWMLV